MWRVPVAITILAAGAFGLYWFARAGDATAVTPALRPTPRIEAGTPIPIPEPEAPDPPPRVRFERRSPPVLDFYQAPFPFLADEDPTASVSLGTVTGGTLVNAHELPLPAEHYAVLPRQLLRGLRYGTADLIDMLRTAATEVAGEFPGSVLWIGNIGRQGGGDIAWSVSHNSGRDADLAFYFTDAAGSSLAPPDLLVVRQDLTATAGDQVYYFDTARTWALVRSLLSHPRASVQHLFVASHLERVLLEYARTNGEPGQLISRAATVLSQPGRGAGAHDDHLHVRTYCAFEDAGRGCEDTGRRHAWVEDPAPMRGSWLAELREVLLDSNAEQRARAIERLVLLRSQDDANRVAARLGDESERVRAAAASGLAAIGTRSHVEALVSAWEDERDGAVLAAIVTALASLGGRDAEQFLIARLERPITARLGGRDLDLRALVSDALGRMEAAAAVPRLVPLLVDEDSLLRARAAWSLSRLTNRRLGDGWEDAALDAASRRDGLQAWRAWLEVHGREPRDSWLVSGFGADGFTVLDGGVDLTALADATGSAVPFVRYNAQRALMQLMERDVPSLTWSTHDSAWYWRAAVVDP